MTTTLTFSLHDVLVFPQASIFASWQLRDVRSPVELFCFDEEPSFGASMFKVQNRLGLQCSRFKIVWGFNVQGSKNMQICKFSQDVRIEASGRTRYCRFTSMPRSAHGFFSPLACDLRHGRQIPELGTRVPQMQASFGFGVYRFRRNLFQR